MFDYAIFRLDFFQCNWPSQLNGSVKAMILADTHLLGPYKGHWLDKFRREWQMHRAFLSAIAIHQPDVVFILGDIFDEGEWVDDEYFRKYVLRFQHLFRTPEHIPVYSAVGNHDVGFHYKYVVDQIESNSSLLNPKSSRFCRLHPHRLDRMDAAFNQTGNQLITIRDNHFLMINSMTMTDDGCWFCEKTKRELLDIAAQLDCAKEKTRKACRRVTRKLNSYSRPILMQHFPTYRNSDAVCLHHDSPKLEVYREGWEVLSRDATDFLVKHFNPHVAFSGHSHHYCQTRTAWGGEEYTVASFSWRNKKNPSFLLVRNVLSLVN